MGEGFEDYQLGVHAGTEVGAVQYCGSAEEQIAPAGDEKSGRESGEIRVKGRQHWILAISRAGVFEIAYARIWRGPGGGKSRESLESERGGRPDVCAPACKR